MPGTQLQDHLHSVTERLDFITVALLSEHPARTHLMAERRLLLKEVTRTCNRLERLSVKELIRTTDALPHYLRLIKKPEVS